MCFNIPFTFKAEQGKSDMEETISELKDLKTNLERQVAELRAKAEQVERRATELRQAEEKKHAEEIDFLKKTNQQLKVSRIYNTITRNNFMVMYTSCTCTYWRWPMKKPQIC